jgi:hypothetical protein
MTDDSFQIVTDPKDDLPHTPQPIPLWSETYLWCAFDPVHRIGLYMHQGTTFFDSTVWRSTLSCCLPNGRILMAKNYGRAPLPHGTGSEALGVTFDDPLRRWTLHLDGACRVVTREENRSVLAGDGVPVGGDIELVFDAATDLLNHGVVHWGRLHHNQHAWAHGHINVAGQEYEFEGPGYRDHSCGPRDLSEYIGSDFCWAAFPSGRTFVAADIFFETPDYNKRYGLVWSDGQYRAAEIVSMPSLESAALDPSSLVLKFDSQTGPAEITGTIEAAINFTHKLPGTELCLGTERSTTTPTDMVVIDAMANYSWDGEVGSGLCEWITPITRPRAAPTGTLPPYNDLPLFRW